MRNFIQQKIKGISIVVIHKLVFAVEAVDEVLVCLVVQKFAKKNQKKIFLYKILFIDQNIIDLLLYRLQLHMKTEIEEQK